MQIIAGHYLLNAVCIWQFVATYTIEPKFSHLRTHNREKTIAKTFLSNKCRSNMNKNLITYCKRRNSHDLQKCQSNFNRRSNKLTLMESNYPFPLNFQSENVLWSSISSVIATADYCVFYLLYTPVKFNAD